MSDLQAVLAELQQALELGLPVAARLASAAPSASAEVDVWTRKSKPSLVRSVRDFRQA